MSWISDKLLTACRRGLRIPVPASWFCLHWSAKQSPKDVRSFAASIPRSDGSSDQLAFSTYMYILYRVRLVALSDHLTYYTWPPKLRRLQPLSITLALGSHRPLSYANKLSQSLYWVSPTSMLVVQSLSRAAWWRWSCRHLFNLPDARALGTL